MLFEMCMKNCSFKKNFSGLLQHTTEDMGHLFNASLIMIILLNFACLLFEGKQSETCFLLNHREHKSSMSQTERAYLMYKLRHFDLNWSNSEETLQIKKIPLQNIHKFCSLTPNKSGHDDLRGTLLSHLPCMSVCFPNSFQVENALTQMAESVHCGYFCQLTIKFNMYSLYRQVCEHGR